MAERTYICYNGPRPTSAAPAVQAASVGAGIKTMQQVQANPVGPPLRIVEWGISFDGITAATPFKVELVETGLVGATVTGYVMPYTTVATIMTAASVSAGVAASVGFPGSGDYVIRVSTTTGGVERMLVTAGQATNTWTVTRNIDGTGSLASIPVGSPVWGDGLSAFQYDIVQQNYSLFFPPTSVVIANSGYNASAEGTIVTTRELAGPQLIAPTNETVFQFPLAREAEVAPGCYARIRVSASSAANCYSYIIFAE